MDLSGWGDFMQGVGSIGQAALLGFAAYQASQTLKNWRTQTLSARKIDQAERILTALYEIKTALTEIRNPSIDIVEANIADVTAKSDKYYDDKPNRILAHVVMNRVDRFKPARDKLSDCRPMARALFGRNVELAIEALCIEFESIRVSAMALPSNINSKQFTDALLERISSRAIGEGKNAYSVRIEGNIKIVESACLPVLSL